MRKPPSSSERRQRIGSEARGCDGPLGHGSFPEVRWRIGRSLTASSPMVPPADGSNISSRTKSRGDDERVRIRKIRRDRTNGTGPAESTRSCHRWTTSSGIVRAPIVGERRSILQSADPAQGTRGQSTPGARRPMGLNSFAGSWAAVTRRSSPAGPQEPVLPKHIWEAQATGGTGLGLRSYPPDAPNLSP